MPFANVFKRLDSVRCINLKDRPDRKKHVIKTLSEHDINVDFYEAIRHPNGGRQGCFESHISVIKEAHDKGCNNVCIFEDDIILNEHEIEDDRGLLDLTLFLRASPDGRPSKFAPDGWSILYLGSVPDPLCYSMSRVPELKGGKIFRVNAVCLHAYIVSKKGMKMMKDWKYNGEHIDQITRDLNDTYGYMPSLFRQGAFDSDIDLFNPHITHVRTQAMSLSDWYAVNINIPGMLWIALLIVLVTLYFLFILNRE